MAEVNLSINGRTYGIHCDDGQEQRVVDLGQYIDSRVKEIAQAGAASNESHLLVLAALVLADEVFDLKDGAANSNGGVAKGLQITEEDETAIVEVIDHMAARIDSIAGNLQKL